jgi:hypothetical protein
VLLASRHSNGHGIFHISSTDQTIKGVFERCNEILETSLELRSFAEWKYEMKRLHTDGYSLPAMPLIESAFSTDEGSISEHEDGTGSERTRFDCTRTHNELEKAGIVAPMFNDDLLRVFVEDMISRDEAARACLKKKQSKLAKRRFA